jgi:hypothetical protein
VLCVWRLLCGAVVTVRGAEMVFPMGFETAAYRKEELAYLPSTAWQDFGMVPHVFPLLGIRVCAAVPNAYSRDCSASHFKSNTRIVHGEGFPLRGLKPPCHVTSPTVHAWR